MQLPLFICLFFPALLISAQQPLSDAHIYYPQPPGKRVHVSAGFVFTTLPQEITEDFRFRVPAAEVHLIAGVSGPFYLDGRIQSQFLQSMFSAGPRYSLELSPQLPVNAGFNVLWWFGKVDIEGFDTHAHGFMASPVVSIGYDFGRNVKMTVQGELLLNLYYRTVTGVQVDEVKENIMNGEAISIIIEQPFYRNKNFALGFRGMYTDFFWQSWALFEVFDRKIFYPQIILGLIL